MDSTMNRTVKYPIDHQGQFTVDGQIFQVTFETDTDYGHPWEECDGHGPVRCSHYGHTRGGNDKRPGERPLNNHSRDGHQYYYDWAEAVRTARRDGWGTQDGRRAGESPRAYAARAVQEDYELLRAYCLGNWEYVGVTVHMVGTDFETSLWGVDTWENWHYEQAHELAAELLAEFRKESLERAEWAARDTLTVPLPGPLPHPFAGYVSV